MNIKCSWDERSKRYSHWLDKEGNVKKKVRYVISSHILFNISYVVLPQIQIISPRFFLFFFPGMEDSLWRTFARFAWNNKKSWFVNIYFMCVCLRKSIDFDFKHICKAIMPVPQICAQIWMHLGLMPRFISACVIDRVSNTLKVGHGNLSARQQNEPNSLASELK